MKADRIPARVVKRMSPEKRQAYDCLRWYSPGPAERGRLKKVLAWKRTHEETVAFARELLDRGLVRTAILDELDITERHLRRLLAEIKAEQVPEAENQARNRSAHKAKTDTTCKSEVAPHPVPGEADTTCKPIVHCASCGRRLEHGRWVVGKDRRLTGKVPYYCWPGEGCNRK